MMLQDIGPHTLRNQYSERTEPKPDNPVFCFRGAKLLIKKNAGHSFEKEAGLAFEGGRVSMPENGLEWKDEKQFYLERGRFLRLPEVAELEAARDHGDGSPAPSSREKTEGGQGTDGALNLTYLFTVDERPTFLLRDDLPDEKIPEGFAFMDIRTMRQAAYGPQHRLFAAITAYQLSNWYRDNRFCGTCGTPTVHSDTERALRCPSCGRLIYPRIIPAVIVGVLNGDRILLTKYAGRDFAHYALIAGFTEIGETFEETVAREVMEEAGVRVKNIRYYKSQPWGIVDDLLAGFYCDVDGDPTIHMDKNELKEAAWHTRDEIVLQPTDHSLTNEMMTRFKQGLEC